MAHSMSNKGQLVSIKVRPFAGKKGVYEIIYGHRRVRAAKALGWKTIKAEVIETSDLDVIEQSLIENFERKDLSDYEKGIAFERLHAEFGETYDQIGKMLGISRQHVSGFVAMARLFSDEDYRTCPSLVDAMHKLSEHHARVLAQIEDQNTRQYLALMIARDSLSVRELNNIVHRLRSWFSREKVQEALNEDTQRKLLGPDESETIKQIVLDEFRLAYTRDFESFKRMHGFDDEFTIFSSFPPTDRLEGNWALAHEKDWFYNVMPKLTFRIEDLKITILGMAALASFRVIYSNPSKPVNKSTIRATLALRKSGVQWRIFHEHWSKVEDPINTVTDTNQIYSCL